MWWLIYAVSFRIQELKDLGELSPHWDNLRKDVISRYDQIIREYQDTLAELEKLTGKGFRCNEAWSLSHTHTHTCTCSLSHVARMRLCPVQTVSAICMRHHTQLISSAGRKSMIFFLCPAAFMQNFLVHKIFIRSSQLTVTFDATLNSHGWTL